jgi:polyisoprenoid-binding protein YceI
MFKSLRVGLLACFVAGCGAPAPRPDAALPAVPAEKLSSAGARIYHIDAAQSELRILVYRAGPMARLGHNHVMLNHALQGVVSLASPRSASSVSLQFPVAEFSVDDARSRDEEGGDFPGEISDDAKAGTKRNMLGSALLNAAAYPVITLESRSIEGEDSTFTAVLSVHVAGYESTISVPFTMVGDDHRLTASGSLQLRQSLLGLTPMSLLMGALQVQDEMRIKFSIVAVEG